MKKRFLTVLTCVLLLAMSTTVFAAGSSTSQSVATPSYASQAKDTAEQKAITNAAAAAVTNSTTESGAIIVSRPVAADEYNTLIAVAEAQYPGSTVLAVADINGNIKPGGESITLNVAGIVAGDNIIVIHHGKGGIEILTPSNVGNGTVTAFFTGLSPVEIIKVAEAPAVTKEVTPADDATVVEKDSVEKKSEGEASATTKSSKQIAPQTGETSNIVFIGLIAIVGIAFCAKKTYGK